MNNPKINAAFQQVFFTVVILTVLSGTTSLWLASQDQLSEHQDRVFETSSSTWQMGVGAVFGLLGGKATELFATAEEDPDDNPSDHP